MTTPSTTRRRAAPGPSPSSPRAIRSRQPISKSPKPYRSALLVERLRAAQLRIAIADVTSPDLLQTPFRVARALGPNFQQIHFGHVLARLGNPRLHAMAPRGINPDPHPLD